MSIENFKPTYWSAEILKTLEKAHVLVGLCNRKYEGQIKGAGDTVKINSIGDITVSDYNPNSTSDISYERLSDALTKLEIDQEKYFAFEIDDVDKAQALGDVMEEAMRKAGYKLNDVADQFIAGLHSQAGAEVVFTSTTTAFSKTSANKAFQKLRQKFDENNVPNEGRWCVVSPWAMSHINLAQITDNTNNPDIIANNYQGKIAGIEIYVSNNLSTMSSTSNQVHALAGTKDAISYAEQIVNTEAIRREGSFKDAVRGLHVYGGKVIRPEQLIDFIIEE